MTWGSVFCSFKGSLPEAAREPNQCFSDLCESAGSYTRTGSAALFRRDWRSVDFGFCFDSGLILFRPFRGLRRGHCLARKTAPNSTTLLPTRRKNRAPAHLPRRGRLKNINRYLSFPAPFSPPDLLYLCCTSFDIVEDKAIESHCLPFSARASWSGGYPAVKVRAGRD